MKDLVKTETHYKNILYMIRVQGEKDYYQLGKVYCDMSRCFFYGGDFTFGMKYMIKAEQTELRKKFEHPNTWALYYLYFTHKKDQQHLIGLNNQATRRKLASHALFFIEIADRLSKEALDPLNIKRL